MVFNISFSAFLYCAVIILSLFFTASHLRAQIPDYPLPQYPEQWNASWITHPDISKNGYACIHFRKTIDLASKPEKFIIHISGDNRYRLYINEVEVVYGPQLSDMRHWRYETLDIAPFLTKGKNIVAAEVMNWGIERSYGIMSFKTGLLIQGNSIKEQNINTNANDWKVLHNHGIHEKEVFWRRGRDIVGGFYAGNPTDSIVASDYPWNWQKADFDDSGWKSAQQIFSQPKTTAGYGHGWILQPRSTPVQENKKEDFSRIARSDIEGVSQNFVFGESALSIPPNSKKTLLIDQGYVTLGYPRLQVSGGKDSKIKIMYSEALYDEQLRKGNRNQIENKEIRGISDVYVLDGGLNRIFQPIWFRTFRFIQLEIHTREEALEINDYYNIFSASPIPLKASFKTDNSMYTDVWNICWHGMKLCAQDNLLSDLYYEQMQYVGDLRPHIMGFRSLTGDIQFFKSALQQFNYSRLPDGNITSCYPLKATFVHPTYSLMWIDMLHDLMMWDGDKPLINSYKLEIQEVFDYYESLINENGLVGKSDYYMFIDWYEIRGGNSAINLDGNSAILTLNYAYTLQKAAEIMKWLGYKDRAFIYDTQSRKYAEIVRKLCYDSEKGIYADDPEKTFYDQRASILAVLCSAHDAEEKKKIMEKVLSEETPFDSKANLFYYFYLFEAMQETKSGDFSRVMQPWKDMVDLGLSATPEKRLEQNPRSEVHPWTAHPVHFYFSLVAGIRPIKPGFSEILIEPQPGSLKNIDLKYPVKDGIINMQLQFSEKGKVTGTIDCPENFSGSFIWQNNIVILKPGINELKL